jgi:hypothetical protein
MSHTPDSTDSYSDDDEETTIQDALHAIRTKGLRPNGRPQYSFRQAAQDYGIPHRYQTLTQRFHGRKTREAISQSQQRLTQSQETRLVEWIKEMGRRGIPMTPGLVLGQASDIYGQKLGGTWLSSFRKRNPSLKSCWAGGVDVCCAQAVNPNVVQRFYDILQDLVNTYEIPYENIYNMDEKGILLGVGKKVKVLVDRNQQTIKRIEDGSRELVTVLETICADGTALPPSFVFKGVKRDLEWGRNNPLDAS